MRPKATDRTGAVPWCSPPLRSPDRPLPPCEPKAACIVPLPRVAQQGTEGLSKHAALLSADPADALSNHLLAIECQSVVVPQGQIRSGRRRIEIVSKDLLRFNHIIHCQSLRDGSLSRGASPPLKSLCCLASISPSCFIPPITNAT